MTIKFLIDNNFKEKIKKLKDYDSFYTFNKTSEIEINKEIEKIIDNIKINNIKKFQEYFNFTYDKTTDFIDKIIPTHQIEYIDKIENRYKNYFIVIDNTIENSFANLIGFLYNRFNSDTVFNINEKNFFVKKCLIIKALYEKNINIENFYTKCNFYAKVFEESSFKILLKILDKFLKNRYILISNLTNFYFNYLFSIFYNFSYYQHHEKNLSKNNKDLLSVYSNSLINYQKFFLTLKQNFIKNFNHHYQRISKHIFDTFFEKIIFIKKDKISLNTISIFEKRIILSLLFNLIHFNYIDDFFQKEFDANISLFYR